MPADSITSAVPAVATSLNPMSTNLRAIVATWRLSLSVTLMNTVPLSGQLLSGGELRFGERLAKIIGHAHDFPGGFHLRTEDRIDTGKFIPRKYRGLYVIAIASIKVGAAFNVFRQKFAQLAAGHQASCDFRHGNARRFRYVRHRSRGARIDFENINFSAFGAVAGHSTVARGIAN